MVSYANPKDDPGILPTAPGEPLLSVRDLVDLVSDSQRRSSARDWDVKAVDGVRFDVQPGKTLGWLVNPAAGRRPLAGQSSA